MAKLTTANHRPEKPDKLFQHASVKPDKLSQHAKCRQAIHICKTKNTVQKEPRTAAVAVQVRRAQYKKTSRAGAEPATTTLQEAR